MIVDIHTLANAFLALALLSPIFKWWIKTVFGDKK